jgi:hypothetical protein
MTTPAAEFYRIERESSAEPMKPQRRGARAIGTALTGVPMPSSRPSFATTLRVLDATGKIVYETFADARTIDALELQMLGDLLKLDVDAFRRAYGLSEEETPS